MNEESDVDEEFKLGVGEVAEKFAKKRKKKYLFNEVGVPIEPFNLKNDIREGIITREGEYKIKQREERRKKGFDFGDSDDEDDVRDNWFDTIEVD
jgi:hypothetical protein